MQFDGAELAKATNDYSKRNLLGRGGFGSVYRGSVRMYGGGSESFDISVYNNYHLTMACMTKVIKGYSIYGRWGKML